MSDLIELINNSARPWKAFKVQIGEKEFEFKTRTLSSAEDGELTVAYNRKFSEIADAMSGDSIDLAVVKKGLARQSKEALAKLIVKNDRMEFLQEASSELDDKPLNDAQVQSLADEKAEEAYKLLLGADEDEIMDEALERRAFIMAAIKAADEQNRVYLSLTCYNLDGTQAFPSPEEISNMDRETIVLLISEVNQALRGKRSTDPLKPRAKKGSAKPSMLQKL